MMKMVHLFGGAATTAERSKELLGGKGSNLAEMASIACWSRRALRSPPTSAPPITPMAKRFLTA